MIQWLALAEAQRRTSLEQAQINSGIIPKAIEKDWWVVCSLTTLLERINKELQRHSLLLIGASPTVIKNKIKKVENKKNIIQSAISDCCSNLSSAKCKFLN